MKVTFEGTDEEFSNWVKRFNLVRPEPVEKDLFEGFELVDSVPVSDFDLDRYIDDKVQEVLNYLGQRKYNKPVHASSLADDVGFFGGINPRVRGVERDELFERFCKALSEHPGINTLRMYVYNLKVELLK